MLFLPFISLRNLTDSRSIVLRCMKAAKRLFLSLRFCINSRFLELSYRQHAGVKAIL